MELRQKSGRRLDDGQTIGYKVLGMLQQIAPDKQAQDACTMLYHRYHGPCKEQDQAMVAALYDGLAYGNWPWVTPGIFKEGR